MDIIKQLKAELKKKTDVAPEKYYPVNTLKENGYHRAHCATCGKYFWTTQNSKICGDPNCTGGYTFIGVDVTKKKMDFIKVWDEFSRHFKKLGYTPIKRYPVVARWRDDVYWTNASIYDFQPYVVNGDVEPPANPLVVPQPCLRFNDIDNVGITGRHYSSFIMIGQHAFQPPDKYDQEKYLGDIFSWLTKGVGLDKNVIKFHEDQWGGGGNMGVSMEFFAHGLELGNQVYMTYEITESGSLRDLRLKVLDMGTGQERYSWVTSGTNTSYEVNFPTVVKELFAQTGIREDKDLVRRFLPYSGLLNFEEVENLDKVWKEIADKLKVDVKRLREEIMQLGAAYAIGDHTRTLLFALADGALPSNVGGQYNLRVLYRRVIDLIKRYGWAIDLEGILENHAKYLKPQYPELRENLDEVYKILRVEREKYENTIEKSRKIVQQLIAKKEKITDEKFVELYDSQGITPELIGEEAKKMKVQIKIPENFYAKVAERHPEVQAKKGVVAKEINISGVSETSPVYYEDTKLFEYKSKVLKVIGKYVILDKTVFFPTGGGQSNDIGTLNAVKVLNVEKIKGVILHEVADPSAFKPGQTVHGVIDKERRMNLARLHDAAHILGGAARKVLGEHIWQAGSQIDPDKGRLDITHFANLTDIEKYEIEKLANKLINEKRKISKKFTPRNEAEEKFGFTLYQGGAVPGKLIRVVQVVDFDAQACGGTHLDNTSETEGIRIVKTEKIQDGVIRLVFVAGKQLLGAKEFGEKELVKSTLLVLEKFGVKIEKASLDDMAQAEKVFTVKAAELPKTFERFLSEIRDNEERMDDLEKVLKQPPNPQSLIPNPQFLQSLNKSKELGTISKLIFEHWKTLRKQARELEDKYSAKVVEDLFVKARQVKGHNIIISCLEDFGLAMRAANSVAQKDENAVVIISTDAKTLCVAGKNAKFSAREVLNTLMPTTNITGDKGRAIASQKLSIPENEARAKLEKTL